MSKSSSRCFLIGIITCLVVLGAIPAVGVAQTGPAGTVVVEENETVSSIDTVAGSVIVRGTVTGDVSAAAGDVHIDGTVEGDVDVAAGNVRITGAVDGDVNAGAGNVHLEDGGTVGGTFQVGAGNVQIDGRIDGNAIVGAETIQLGETASIGGSLRYDGSLQGNRDAVEGEVIHDPTLGSGISPALEPIVSGVFAVYAFFLNLILGTILLALFPRFSDRVADRVATAPLRTGLIGLGVFVGIPLLLIALAITVVGIPLSIAGAFLFIFVAWIALVYGRFAVGAWLLSLVGYENRWVALILGLFLGSILGLIPFVGGILNFLIFLLGLGALSYGLYTHRRRTPSSPAPTISESAGAE